MDIQQKSKTFFSELGNSGFCHLFLAINKNENRVIESVNMSSKDVGFAIFKLASDSKDEEFADVVIKAAMAAKQKLKFDKNIDGEVDDMLSKLKLN